MKHFFRDVFAFMHWRAINRKATLSYSWLLSTDSVGLRMM